MDNENPIMLKIIAIIGLCIWFIFPFGMFLSVMRQDIESKTPHLNQNPEQDDGNIFGHKEMSYYNDELEDLEIPENDLADVEEANPDEDFIHPHTGIGSTHVHHVSP